MSSIINFFYIILYQPLFNALVFLYVFVPGHDFGIAIILLTLAIKLLFYPLATKGIKSQKALSTLQPKIKEVQDKYKNDKERQSKELMELYKKEGVNPLSGCLPMLVQLPILIVLFRLFIVGFGPDQLHLLYSFMPHPGAINTMFLGILDLAKPSIILAVITGAAQYFQTKMTTPETPKKAAGKSSPDFSQIMQKQMLYFFPLFTVFILWKMPSAVALYWLATTIFTIGQQYIILKNNVAGEQKQN